MSDKADIKEKTEKCAPCGSCARGNTALFIGAVFTITGVMFWVMKAYLCIACIIAAPLFLGIGIMQRVQYMRRPNNVCSLPKK